MFTVTKKQFIYLVLIGLVFSTWSCNSTVLMEVPVLDSKNKVIRTIKLQQNKNKLVFLIDNPISTKKPQMISYEPFGNIKGDIRKVAPWHIAEDGCTPFLATFKLEKPLDIKVIEQSFEAPLNESDSIQFTQVNNYPPTDYIFMRTVTLTMDKLIFRHEYKKK